MQCSPEAGSPDVSGLAERAGEIEIKVESPAEEFDSDNSSNDHPRSTLIEFPGISRRAEPPWRKELSRRVREAQERKAREAAEARVGIHSQPASPDPLISQLELVPQLPTPAMNQIVENALRRVGRARRVDPFPRPSTKQSEPIQSPDLLVAAKPTEDQKLAPAEPETAAGAEVEPPPIETQKKKRSLNKPQLVAVTPMNVKEEKPRARTVSLTADIEKVAVSYLESHFPSAASSDPRAKRAGFGIRFVSAICDLLFIGLLTLPFAAGIEFALLPAVAAGVDGACHHDVCPITMCAPSRGVMVDVHRLDPDPAGSSHLGEVHPVAHDPGLHVLLHRVHGH